MARIERAEKLIKRYEQARERIQTIILRKEQSGHPITYYQAVLRRIDRELAKLKKEIAKEMELLAREQYDKAIRRAAISAGLSVAAVALAMQSGRLKESPAGYARPNIPTIEEISFDKQREAVNALQTVGRQIRDTIRELSLEVASEVTGSQTDVRNAQKRLSDALLGADGTGLGGIEYKNGSVMPFDKYAQMVIRSTVREANNTGAIEVAAFVGSGLVKLTSHWPTCHICAPRQGRVYRLVDFPDGDERNAFPTIDKAFPGWPTYANIHPNCRHNMGALPQWVYIPEEERKRLLADAGKPFDVDPRAEAEINAYNLEQRLKRLRNEDAKHYMRYKAVLGDAMPTFSGWRRMKAANSERYQELRADYRYALKIIKKESIMQTGHGGLPVLGEPNATKDLVRPDGVVKQRRVYGSDGRALIDFDNSHHSNPNTHPYAPHAHDWDYNRDKPRGEQREMTDAETRQNADMKGDGDD